jgi:hypothetical protein
MKARCAPIRRPARHVHGVAVPVVPLPREVRTRVTVHAARMLKNRRQLPEFLSSLLKSILRSSVLDEHDGPRRNDDADDRRGSAA